MRLGSLGASVNGRLGAFFARNSAHVLQDKIPISNFFTALLNSFSSAAFGVMSGLTIVVFVFWGSADLFHQKQLFVSSRLKMPHVSRKSEAHGWRETPKQTTHLVMLKSVWEYPPDCILIAQFWWIHKYLLFAESFGTGKWKGCTCTPRDGFLYFIRPCKSFGTCVSFLHISNFIPKVPVKTKLYALDEVNIAVTSSTEKRWGRNSVFVPCQGTPFVDVHVYLKIRLLGERDSTIFIFYVLATRDDNDVRIFSNSMQFSLLLKESDAQLATWPIQWARIFRSPAGEDGLVHMKYNGSLYRRCTEAFCITPWKSLSCVTFEERSEGTFLFRKTNVVLARRHIQTQAWMM